MLCSFVYLFWNNKVLNFFVSYEKKVNISKSFISNYNGVKIGGEVCFRGDIDVFIRMHKLINLLDTVNNELKWCSHNL